MNKVWLIGNLTRDPEVTETNDKVKARFTIGVQRPFKSANGDRESDFPQIECWGKTAELARDYLKKGSKISLEGSVRTGSYDKQDGTKVYFTIINADNFQFLNTKSESEELGAKSGANKLRKPPAAQASQAYDDDELPF